MPENMRFALHFSGQDAFDQEAKAHRLLSQTAPTEHAVRARLHAIRAASRILTAPDAAQDSAAESAREARLARDEVSHAWALVSACVVNVSPDAVARRSADSREALRIARATGETEFVPITYFLHLGALAEQGAIAALDLALSPTGELLSTFPWLQEERHVAWFRCLRVTIDGQAENAERIAGEALSVALEHGDPDAHSVWVGQLAIIRWMQGRVVELEPAFLHARQSAPHEPVWAVSLAWMWLQQGRRSAARALITTLPPVHDLPLDRNWLATTCILAVVAARLGEKEIAAEVRDKLLPFEERLATVGLGVTCWGTVSRPLALIAETLGDIDGAIEHYRRAIAVAARIGAHPWLAEAQTELAMILARLPAPADRDEASALALEAAATGRALQLRGIEESAAVVLASLERGEEDDRPDSAAPDTSPLPAIRVLGAFEVASADGTPARWQSRKARSLLKILVSKRGVAVSRETVMHLLWPDEAPDRLANRFSVAATTVRRALDPTGKHPNDRYLELGNPLVRLCVEQLDIDVERFLTQSQAALSLTTSAEEKAERLREALDTFTGDALADDPEDLWAEDLRRDVHVSFFAVAHALAEASVDAGDHLTRVDCYRRILALDDYDQRAHAGLVDALSRLGAMRQASAARATYSQRMAELGITGAVPT